MGMGTQRTSMLQLEKEGLQIVSLNSKIQIVSGSTLHMKSMMKSQISIKTSKVQKAVAWR